VVKVIEDIVQCYCAVCGGYCVYSNSIHSAMIHCCVCGYFVVRARVDIVQ